MADLFGLNPIAVDPTQTFSGTVAPTPAQASGLTDADIAWKKRHSGVSGVGHDILGYLGDFLLSRLHMGTPYQTSQKQHQLNYAWDQGGNSDDPNQQLAAIDAVQKIDFNEGAKLRENFVDNQRQQAALASAKEARDSRIAAAQQATRNGALSHAANYFNGLASLPEDKRPAAYAAGRSLWKDSATIQNDPELASQLEELYGPDYDENQVKASIAGSVPVSQQWSARDRATKMANQDELGHARLEEKTSVDQARLGQGQQRIDIAQARADKPSGSSRDPRVITYTGEDGYRYAQTQGGKVYKSNQRVRQAGGMPALPSTSGPPVGFKNKYGLTFKGGNPNDRSNWK